MRAALAGLAAALQVPLVLRGRGLESLLHASTPSPRSTGPAPGEAVRWARGAVSRLARVPGSPWRDTCLYRSAAECLVLRRYGIPAVLKIGVRSEEVGEIAAHAWVERSEGSAGTAGDGGAERFAPFRPRPST